MNEILCKFFSFAKYILLIIAFGLVFYGVMVTHSRLGKPLSDSMDIFFPFLFVFVIFLANLFIRNKSISENLFFNFVSVLVFSLIILICYRSMFDTNMLLYHKYDIKYNPSFFSDNLSAIKVMLYMLGASDIILLGCDFIGRKRSF